MCLEKLASIFIDLRTRKLLIGIGISISETLLTVKELVLTNIKRKNCNPLDLTS
jgi:hypothetical protein